MEKVRNKGKEQYTLKNSIKSRVIFSTRTIILLRMATREKFNIHS